MKRVRVSSGRGIHFEDEDFKHPSRQTLCGWPVTKDYDQTYNYRRRLCGPCIVEAYHRGKLVEKS